MRPAAGAAAESRPRRGRVTRALAALPAALGPGRAKGKESLRFPLLQGSRGTGESRIGTGERGQVVARAGRGESPHAEAALPSRPSRRPRGPGRLPGAEDEGKPPYLRLCLALRTTRW